MGRTRLKFTSPSWLDLTLETVWLSAYASRPYPTPTATHHRIFTMTLDQSEVSFLPITSLSRPRGSGLPQVYFCPSGEIIFLQNPFQSIKQLQPQFILSWGARTTMSLLCPFNVQASLVVQLVKNMPAMQETLVWFPGWEDPLEKG